MGVSENRGTLLGVLSGDSIQFGVEKGYDFMFILRRTGRGGVFGCLRPPTQPAETYRLVGTTCGLV